jgi:alpha-D-ribose 1-methylphosphonate 5-phosphate C-P lyase
MSKVIWTNPALEEQKNLNIARILFSLRDVESSTDKMRALTEYGISQKQYEDFSKMIGQHSPHDVRNNRWGK